MKFKVKLFLIAELILFILMFLFLFNHGYYNVSFYMMIYFILILLVTNNISMFFATENEFITTIILPVLFPVMVLAGPFWTAVISAIGSTELKFRNNFVWYKFLFNRTMFFLAGGGAALVYEVSNNFFDSKYLIFSFFLVSITYFSINNGLMFIILKLTTNKVKSPSLYFLELPKNLISSYFLGILFYFSYIHFGKFFFLLLIILIYVIKDFLYSRLQQLNIHTQIIESFLKVIDSKDHYTEGHCQRVADYTCMLCKELGLPKTEINRIVNIAKIHDIGKIYVDDHILKSNNCLTIEEYEEMKKHSIYGYELLKDIDLLQEDLEIMLYHHEWYNGQGYPEGIKGEEIPRGARILAICDAFDVMTTGRSYKKAKSKKEVIAEFLIYRGKQFDPDYADTMVSLIKANKFDDSFKNDLNNENAL